jgi:hypothetical protein
MKSPAALKRYVDQYTPLGQLFLFLGAGALVVDAGMSYAFGSSMSKWHAIGFALCAFFLAFLPDAAYREHEHGRKGTAAVLGLLCIPLGIVAYYTHVGYTVGQRVMDADTAQVQNAKYDDTRESVDEGKRSLKLAEARLKDLEAANAWAPAVTATALRAQLETHQKAIDLEAARGGCKAKCNAEMAKKAALESRIAILEERTALTEKIEATKRWLDTARTQAKGAEKKTSQAVNQNKFVSQLVLAYAGADTEAALNPDATTQNFVQIFISAMVALVGIIMAPVGMFVAGRNRKGFAEIAATARKAMATVTGTDPASGALVLRETHTVEDPRALHKLGDAANFLRARLGAAAA